MRAVVDAYWGVENAIRRVPRTWATYGLPRCTGYRDGRICWRLLWPWFRLGGDGEHVLCWDCSVAYHTRDWDDEEAA